jgi:serine protease AprX
MHSTSSHAGRRTAALLTVALAGAGLAAVPASAGAAPSTAVVVTSLTGNVGGAAHAVQAAGGRVLERLSLIGGVTATLPAGTVLPPSYSVVENSRLHVAGQDSDSTGAAVGVRSVLGLNKNGHEGRGVTVAVVDTGVADVADLRGRVTHVNVTGGQGGDGFGHGTFVAGLIAGDGSSSDGAFAGVAPGANVLDVKVADASGGTDLVTVLKGLQAVAAAGSVDVVNLSLSSGSPLPYQIDPLTAALEALWRRGVTVVVPAGNDGDQSGTISSPGIDPVLLTAGGLDDRGTPARADDTVAPWSSRGPAPQGVQKPDLVAPGTHVVSLRDPGSAIDKEHPSAVVGNDYFKGSGTSFSTAVTAGAAAALLSRHGNLTPDQVKAALIQSAYGGSGLTDPDAAGAGALDLKAAYNAKVKDVAPTVVAPIPGDPVVWAALLNALLTGDQDAAASSWSKLSDAARNWAASSWSSLSPDARNWAASSWSASSWSGGDWAARNWAARNWAARNWADSDWSASSWSARNWAASSWSARNWADDDWAARNWAASSWSARNWAATWL